MSSCLTQSLSFKMSFGHGFWRLPSLVLELPTPERPKMQGEVDYWRLPMRPG